MVRERAKDIHQRPDVDISRKSVKYSGVTVLKKKVAGGPKGCPTHKGKRDRALIYLKQHTSGMNGKKNKKRHCLPKEVSFGVGNKTVCMETRR